MNSQNQHICIFFSINYISIEFCEVLRDQSKFYRNKKCTNWCVIRREFIIEYQSPSQKKFRWLKFCTQIMIGLVNYIKKRVNILAAFKGGGVRKYFAVLHNFKR